MGKKEYKIIVSRTACLKKKKNWAPQTAEFMAYFPALCCFDILDWGCIFWVNCLHPYAT